MNKKQVPASVLALAQKVGMTPLDWAEYPDRIVIIFVEGQKLTFQREADIAPSEMTVVASTEPVPAPPAADVPPPSLEAAAPPAKPKTRSKKGN